jgi:arsenical resistance protein ArsH
MRHFCIAKFTSTYYFFALRSAAAATTFVRPFHARATTFRSVEKPNANIWASQLHQFRGGHSNSSTTAVSNSSDDTSTLQETIAMTENNPRALWSDDDKEAFASREHAGYAASSDPLTHTGGWNAYKAAYEPDENGNVKPCWIKDSVEGKITQYNYSTMPIGRGPRILVLYGSLRPDSFSRKCAYEFARLLNLLGCDVRVYNPRGLPVRDPDLEHDIKVVELRALAMWSEGHVWVSPEMHGTITGVFKNQIDWIPLNTGSVRPTQGRTCQVAQVNGGSQSFNAVNALRILARWMRMPCSTNQSSIAKAWQEFDEHGRMKPSDFRDRLVDCCEEFAKFTAVMVPVADELTDRYSERKEKEQQGRLLTQAEKEAEKMITEARKG